MAAKSRKAPDPKAAKQTAGRTESTSKRPPAGPTSTGSRRTAPPNQRDLKDRREDEAGSGRAEQSAPKPRKPRASAIESHKLEKTIERGIAQGVPLRVVAAAFNLSDRQARRYAARVKTRWAESVEEDHLQKALARIENDAQAGREMKSAKGLQVALRAEALLADLVARKSTIAALQLGRENYNAPTLAAEDALEELAAGAGLYDRLRLGTGEPETTTLPATFEVVEDAPPAPPSPPPDPNRYTPPPVEPRPAAPPPDPPPGPAVPEFEVEEEVTMKRTMRTTGLSWEAFLGRPIDPLDPDAPYPGDPTQQELLRMRARQARGGRRF